MIDFYLIDPGETHSFFKGPIVLFLLTMYSYQDIGK